MRIAALALILSLTAVPAAADQCDAFGRDIAGKIGATVLRRIGPAIKMAHPQAESLQVDCQDGRATNVAASRSEPGPLQPFALMVGRAVSLAYGVTDEVALDAMVQCVKRASARAGTVETASAHGLKSSCYVLRSQVSLDVKQQ